MYYAYSGAFGEQVVIRWATTGQVNPSVPEGRKRAFGQLILDLKVY
jgi:hypothetical protein